MKVTYDWLKEYVGEVMPSVEKLEELLTFHAFEVDGIETVGTQTVIDVKVLPDRASDSLSHRGIAREISTLIGEPLAKDTLRNPVTLEPHTDKIKVTIADPALCPRFAGALLTGVTVTESPAWLKERLQALGQRSINNVVDATNYVMLALGQPLHAYDADTFREANGVWHFGVRLSRADEAVTILNGETITLPDDVALITNAGQGDVPVGIAGIKGGKSAEINSNTRTIILESANFSSHRIRKGSQKIKLQTDASKRFENNISPELVPYALKECVSLIESLAGGKCEGYIDVQGTWPHNQPVTVTTSNVQSILGAQISSERIEDILQRLGCTYTHTDSVWQVTAPFERTDITIPEDVIAEIGRVYGYAHIASVPPQQHPVSTYNAKYYYTEKIRTALVQSGFSEIITSTFKNSDSIELQNALASDKRFLRSSLRENISDALNRNFPHMDILGLTNLHLFEIGTVFEKTSDGTDVIEHTSLAIGVRTKQTASPKDTARIAEVIAQLESLLGTTLNAVITEGVGECNLSLVLPLLPAPTHYDAYQAVETTYTPYALFPSMTRDVAFWTKETVDVPHIESLLTQCAGALLARLTLFDEFKKDDRVSHAYRLVFQSRERTLTDSEINPIMEQIYTFLKEAGYEIR